jgi:N-acetylglutamate synthase-like GNAT family acetyltransferase
LPNDATRADLRPTSPVDTTTIRKATVREVDGILECLRSAFAPYERNYSAAAFEDTTLTWESLLRRLDDMTVFVALNHSGRVVGTVACNVIGQTEGHLRGMAVLPECQACGIADKLLAHAEVELAQRNCSRITLDTTEPLRKAMRFYERHGFRRSGKIGDFFGMPLIEYAKVLTSNQ